MLDWMGAGVIWPKGKETETNTALEMALSDQGVVQSGLVSGTRLATPSGWRTVETIAPGDKVLTFDAGMQVVTAVHRAPLWQDEGPCPRSLWPVQVPPGALGNRDLLLLAPDQATLIESDLAEEILGDPFALIPARVLDGVRSMCRVPPEEGVEIVTLSFASEQIVFANSGAMFHCLAEQDIVSTAMGGAIEPVYEVLDLMTAGYLAMALEKGCLPGRSAVA